ncbi:uncharacterized protein LOC131667862 [Phymastichus coffea]|uniref:uncharacterized protein LOC131667862 n=1 Tax=Phymastichus coffea TaxID=108790 RepID=UPI00273C19FB|nr:uncharacterized protein LOC131667862 [Phymastichus coffea]
MVNLFIWCTLHLVLFVSGNAEKVIIDTDAGSDDAIAILLLLRAESLREMYLPHYELIGITCTYGNTEEENVEINVLKTLTIANRTDILVFPGAKKPLIGNFSSDGFFGKDGFGDADLFTEIAGKINTSKHASNALVDLSKEHEGNISVIVLGPTTNVALAASLDSNFIKRIKKFYVMGSTISGIGVIKPNVEFNFGADPESNFILLNSTTSDQTTLFPYDTGLNANISKKWRNKILGTHKSPYIKFLNAIERISLQRDEQNYAPLDAMTVAAMLWPGMIKDTVDANVQAVYDGAARGSVLIDWNRNKYKPETSNAKIIKTIDSKMFMDSLVYYLTCNRLAC